VNLYEEVGIRPFINARAPYTRFGGALMPDEVVQAMAEASKFGVHMAELHEKIGQAIAKLTHNEAAYVSCGAASGITLVLAYCMVGMDEQKADLLPFTESLPNRVVMHRCERGTECDTAVRCAGAVAVTIGDEDGASEKELCEAIDSNTVAVITLEGEHPGKIPLPRMVAIAHERGVPLIMDGAASVPPRENFWRYTRDADVDAIVISGGKGVRGPQSTGLVLGARHIIEGCRFHGVPNCRIGRGMKVGKEELFGAYAAVKRTMAQDEAGIKALHEWQADSIVEQLSLLPNVSALKVEAHRVEVHYDERFTGMSYSAAYDWFQCNEPGILLGGILPDGLRLNTAMLQPGEEQTIVDQFRRLFAQQSR
jgi:L-seryl-tRNA(Ser) seleniumtransferase